MNKKHKNAANEINPSKKSANNPDNSLNKAPVAAKMSGHECVNISKIIFYHLIIIIIENKYLFNDEILLFIIFKDHFIKNLGYIVC